MTGVGMPEFLAVMDTETNGVDTETCRVVTAFVGLMATATGQLVESKSWLLNIGEDIPQGAIDVHGITNEKMRAEGMDAKLGIFEIVRRLDVYQHRGIATVVMNARFDYTLLDREQRRFYPGMRVLEPFPVIDPYVLDKALDKYRKGKRRLVNLAEHYGVAVREDAHDAEADCWMAGNVAIKLLHHERLRGLSVETIHKKTVHNAREQAESFADYLRKQGKPEEAAGVQSPWPVVPYVEPDYGF